MKCIFVFIIALNASALAKPEVWAYLHTNEENFFPKKSIITDIAHFDAQVTTDGNLINPIPSPPIIKNLQENTRRHLVITAPYNKELFHYYLHPNLPLRKNIINNIVKCSHTYDGIQIDFEGIGSEDGVAFLNFLINLKSSLPKDKIFSVAVMPRWDSYKQANPLDAYDYALIGRIADRVIIMAYDEHWRTGPPGPIASLPWCQKVFNHALKLIPKEKIIMGIPLYGRSWMPKKAPVLSKQMDIDQILSQLEIQSEKNLSGGSFEFQEKRTIHVYHETQESIKEKQKLYLGHPIGGTAYWRIGQEPVGFWENYKN